MSILSEIKNFGIFPSAQTPTERAIAWLGVAVLAAIALVIAVPRVINADAVVADLGFSPLDYVVTIMKPGMAADFPEGIQESNLSLPMHLAHTFYASFGLDPVTYQRLIYAAEPVAVIVTGWMLARTLVPNASTGFYLIFVLLFSASNLRNSNFGVWQSPIYYGLYYIFAESFGIVGLTFLFKRRYIPAAACLAVAATGHAIIGLCFAVFGAAALLCRPREILTRPVLIAAALFFAATGLWFGLTLDWSHVIGGAISSAEWVTMTMWGSYHTFPIDAEIFGARHTTYVTGFCAFVLLFATYLSMHADRIPYKAEIVAGSAAAMLLVAIGLWASVAKTDVTLIKLHLHRANMMVLLVGSPVVVYGLWTDIRDGTPARAVFAVFALALPFYFAHGIALAPALALTGLYLADGFEQRAPRAHLLTPAIALAVVVVIYVYYFYTGLPPSHGRHFAFFRQPVMLAAMAFGLAAAVAIWLSGAPKSYIAVAFLLALAVIAARVQSNGPTGYLGYTRDPIVLATMAAGLAAVLALRLYGARKILLAIPLLLMLGTLATKAQIEGFAWRGERLDYARDYLAVQRWAAHQLDHPALAAAEVSGIGGEHEREQALRLRVGQEGVDIGPIGFVGRGEVRRSAEPARVGGAVEVFRKGSAWFPANGGWLPRPSWLTTWNSIAV